MILTLRTGEETKQLIITISYHLPNILHVDNSAVLTIFTVAKELSQIIKLAGLDHIRRSIDIHVDLFVESH